MRSVKQGAAARKLPVSLYSYSEYLERIASDAAGKRKGERTRDRILAATARLLNERGFRGLRHTDICEASGIAVATFYLYFEDKLDACRTVLEGFLLFMTTSKDDSLARLEQEGRQRSDPYVIILCSNLIAVRQARANTGLLRCFFETSGETEEFVQLWRTFSSSWYNRTAQNLLRRGIAQDPDKLLFSVFLVGGMVDDCLRALFLTHDGLAQHVSARLHRDDLDLAETLTLAWYRVLFGKDPSLEELETSRALAR